MKISPVCCVFLDEIGTDGNTSRLTIAAFSMKLEERTKGKRKGDLTIPFTFSH